jgi:hypothetical protein
VDAERLKEIKSWLKHWPEHNVVEVLPDGLIEIKENAPAIIWELLKEVERLQIQNKWLQETNDLLLNERR